MERQNDFIRKISARLWESRRNSSMNPWGPGLEQCCKLLREKSVKAVKDVLSLLDWVIFNYLVGNSDAHAKNLSFLLLRQGPFLAPFYDLLSTRIYGHVGVASALAMRIGGESDPAALRRGHWETLADQLGISSKFLLARVVSIAGRVENVRLGLFKGSFAQHACDTLYRLNEFLAENCAATVRKLS